MVVEFKGRPGKAQTACLGLSGGKPDVSFPTPSKWLLSVWFPGNTTKNLPGTKDTPIMWLSV